MITMAAIKTGVHVTPVRGYRSIRVRRVEDAKVVARYEQVQGQGDPVSQGSQYLRKLQILSPIEGVRVKETVVDRRTNSLITSGISKGRTRAKQSCCTDARETPKAASNDIRKRGRGGTE